MRLQSFTGWTLATFAAIAPCSGCSRSSVPDPVVSDALALARSSSISTPGFAVSEFFGSKVLVFGRSNRGDRPPICSVRAFHAGDLTSDKSGNLYVPNGDGTIVEYAPHCGPQIARWHDGFGQPVDLAVSGNNVYAASTGTGAAAGNVAVCTRAMCGRVLTQPSIALIFGVTVDSNGNVWGSVSTDRTNASLVLWRGGTMPGRIVSGFANPDSAGIEFDNRGTLLAIDPLRTSIYTYTCSAATASCAKTGRWPLRYEAFFGKLDEANTQFQAANNGSGGVDVYSYPGFVFQYSYDNGLSYNMNVVGIGAFPD